MARLNPGRKTTGRTVRRRRRERRRWGVMGAAWWCDGAQGGGRGSATAPLCLKLVRFDEVPGQDSWFVFEVPGLDTLNYYNCVLHIKSSTHFENLFHQTI